MSTYEILKVAIGGGFLLVAIFGRSAVRGWFRR